MTEVGRHGVSAPAEVEVARREDGSIAELVGDGNSRQMSMPNRSRLFSFLLLAVQLVLRVDEFELFLDR